MYHYNKPSTSGGESTYLLPPKRMRYHYRLASESSEDETEGTESIYSFQGYETELAMDTPDTDTKSEYEYSNDEFEIEYDVQSLSGEENVPIGNDSSSGAEDFTAVASAIAAVTCEPLLESSLTDGEYSDNSSTPDIEIHRTDYDVCLQCKLVNDNPLFRYCKKCFQVRKAFFPPRPRGFKKKDGKTKDCVVNSNSDDFSKENDITRTASSPSLGSCPNDKVESSEDSGKSSGSLQSALSEHKKLCIICNVESKNSIFLHGSVAHMCCCYKCALKSWRLNKKCPACNGKANSIVKVFEL